MKRLSITRAIVGAAVSMHLLGLKSGVAAKDRKVNTAMKRSDTAVLGLNRAQDAVTEARVQRNAIRDAERATKRERDGFVAAAVAEADSLRRNHTVGA